ncbi:MAG: STAS domain-containing protein [Pirellulaceae bacterium]|jgi:anti-anti-sigma regulatory factor|nr:STAS domain-containing protein [Pirellulaceae bacterium]MDP6723359.1 STAS domain-containing protein [Pirellulaceae bacterium]
MADYQHFSVQLVDDVAVLQVLAPRLSDSLTVSEFQDELLEMIETELPKELVVSFKGVLCCSTAVINGLLRAKKQLLVSDGSLRLCGMSDVIREAYRMLHLDGTVFDIDDTLEESLAAFAR